MQEARLDRLGQLFLALSDKTRLRLLALMAEGEVSVGYLADELGEGQPKISRHLAYLRGAKLVSTRRDGKKVYYGIDASTDTMVASVLVASLTPLVSTLYEDPRHQVAGYVGAEYAPSLSHSETRNEASDGGWKPEELPIYLL